ncbi:MAG: hypothetical protein LBE13_05230 [Bacteroidales bacterium]|jgi:hypothetical protein|nr:hypothetical protein [Bacteroidales bacterium]
MKKKNLLIIGYFLLVHFALAQNEQIGTLKKIEGIYYIKGNGKNYLANPSVVTVKLKNGVEQSKIVLDTIRVNKFGYIDISVPNGLDLVEFLDSLKNTNDFAVIEYNSFGEFCSDFIPNDPQLGNQWYLDAINVFEARQSEQITRNFLFRRRLSIFFSPLV